MIEFYIGDKLADVDESTQFLMNYELEKIENPTIIKNNFSKTVKLKATPNNNDIFGYYFQLDRITEQKEGENTGIFFDANKRVSFQLFNNYELLESGYIQLNNINITNGEVSYEITLYGGLGDFFYNLSYDTEGNEKTLADLYYNINEDRENEMNFAITKQTVYAAWQNIDNPNSLYNHINFIPSYNGLYNNFDNDKVLINTNNNTNFTLTSITNDNVVYSTINGYALGELNNEYTEWEMRDLRSYKQRPALRFKTFLTAICNPENNGGYEVELDNNFFNTSNPYYSKTWLALPLLSPEIETINADLSNETSAENTSVICYPLPQYPSNNNILDGSSFINVEGYTTNNKIDFVEDYTLRSLVDVECDFSLETNTIYNRDFLSLAWYQNKFCWSAVGVWLEATVDGMVIGNSNCVVFSNNLYSGSNVKNFSMDLLNGNYVGNPDTEYQFVNALFNNRGLNENFDYEESVYNYSIQSLEGDDTSFHLKMENVPNYKDMQIKLKIARWYNKDNKIVETIGDPGDMTIEYKYYTPYLSDPLTNNTSIWTFGIYAIPSNFNLVVKSNPDNQSLTGSKITKQNLLKSKITPASILLSFTKLFGMYFIKDIDKKKITICQRNKFFNGEVEDISDNIDYTQMSITPLSFNKKWYLLKKPALETTQMSIYKNRYDEEYGQKKINTNYYFNNEVEDIYSNNVFQNVITIDNSSKYYRHFISTKNSYFPPSFCNDGLNYTLFNDNYTYAQKYNINDFINWRVEPIYFNQVPGADAMSKLCCFSRENDKQSLTDLSLSLVIYNGNQYLYDLEGNPIYYTVSDDVPEMLVLNDGTPCYIYSESEYNKGGLRIAYKTNELPQFTNYNISENNIVESLDFGMPRETYFNYNYPNSSTLYNNFWQSLYIDQLNKNTKKVQVTLVTDKPLNNSSFRKFYFFDNSYWLLNKINNYDLSNNNRQKVKCEFIKINDINNYQNQKSYIARWFVEGDVENAYIVVSDDNVVNDGDSWGAKFDAEFGIESVNVSMGGEDITNEAWNPETNTIAITAVTDDVYYNVFGNDQPERTCKITIGSSISGYQNDYVEVEVNGGVYTFNVDFDRSYTQTELLNTDSIFDITIFNKKRDIGNVIAYYTFTTWEGEIINGNITITGSDNYYEILNDNYTLKEIYISFYEE